VTGSRRSGRSPRSPPRSASAAACRCCCRWRYSDTNGWYSNYRIGETTAAAKTLIDQSNDQIVGAHLLGPEYGELVNTLGLPIKLGLSTRQLKSATAAYPTVGSDLGPML
jgi:glutathione reductase (NADPH)